MEELLDMIITDESPSQISDTIKDMIYSKAAERVDTFKPSVANSILSSTEDAEEEIEVESDE